MTRPLAMRVPRVFARVLALAGLSLAAVTADVSMAAAQPGQLPQMFNDPAVTSYRLTTASLDKFVRATNALKELDIEDRFESMDDEDVSVAEIAAALDSEPRIKNAINGAGMTSREYITFMLAMVQAALGSAMVQMGGEQALNDMPAGVLKDNIRFVTEHQEALEALDDDHDHD
jgi:hypothetical protein